MHQPNCLSTERTGTDEVRICTDARLDNRAILRERNCMPTIDDLIHRLDGAKVISKFDLKSGYNQIPMSEDGRAITAFCTHVGIFQYKRLNFGINTAVEIFQKAIDRAIGHCDGANKMTCFWQGPVRPQPTSRDGSFQTRGRWSHSESR